MLVLRGSRYMVKATWAGIDFLAPTWSSPVNASTALIVDNLTPRLALVHTALESQACLPTSQWPNANADMQKLRPAYFPGKQSVTVGRAPFCTGSPTTPGVCWPKESLQLLLDVALYGSASGLDARFQPAGYVVLVRNGVILCNFLITDECIVQRGTDTCLQQAGVNVQPGSGVIAPQTDQGGGGRSLPGSAQAAGAGQEASGISSSTLAVVIALPVCEYTHAPCHVQDTSYMHTLNQSIVLPRCCVTCVVVMERAVEAGWGLGGLRLQA